MKLGVLFSGGKDSSLALYKAGKVEVLITLDSKNKDSYMFHTPIDEVEKLTHYSNQQPLWAIENLKKSNR